MIRRAPLSDLLGDRVAYRNMEPLDPSVPGFRALRNDLGLPPGAPPRKPEGAFAPLILRVLREAQRSRGVPAPVARLLVVGDSKGSDGAMAVHLSALMPVRAFIGCDRPSEAPAVVREGCLTLANRWAALDPFLGGLGEEGFTLDESSAVIVDVDKTAIGARGRNDRPIDLSRLDAAGRILRAALGDNAPADALREAYGALSDPACHGFTRDNQDFLVYASIMASAGPWTPGEVVEAARSGRLVDFGSFVGECGRRLAGAGPAGLRSIHDEVAANLAQGDPTPFKSFRREEFLSTVARMDALPDDAPRRELLAEEITFTAEILEGLMPVRDAGALLFALSDKPAEAAAPGPGADGRTPAPLHRLPMKVLGAT